MSSESPAVREALPVYEVEAPETEGVPPGYRQTEVGVIPEDWATMNLGNVVTLQRGYDLPQRARRSGTVPIVSSSGIYDTHSQSQVRGPGVVTGRYGTVGEVFFIEEDFWPLNTTLFISDFKGNDPLFISYMLRTIDFASHSGKSGVPGVNRNDLHQLTISLPPPLEQRAIAAALSDVDALISALDKLIAKKRVAKTAAMQQLLTGKQRLPGFSGEWQMKRLGEIGSFSKGRGLAKHELSSSGELPAIPYTAIYTDLDEVIEPSKLANFVNPTSSAVVINSPHLLIAGSSNMLENIGKATAFNDYTDTVIGGDIILYKTSADVAFLSYLLNTRAHRELIISLAQGSTIRHVYAATFRDYEISLPKIEEQRAIVTVLSDMDAEIEALKARREKTRQVKQGMMQELLTGKTRLV